MEPTPSAPPPAYGATADQYPPVQSSAPYPQPGQHPPPPAGGYSEPPPKYEPPKDGQQQYPPPPGQPYSPYQQQPQGAPPGGYPYQQPPPPQGYQGATVYPGQPVVHQTVIVSQPGYGPLPKTLECPNCHATVTTSLTYQAGGLTYLSAGLLCLFGCWMGCCLIPFCIDDLSDVQHRCPNCGKHVATYTRL